MESDRPDWAFRPALDRPEAHLVVATGDVFAGYPIGADTGAIATGEVVFNTVMTGYQEVLTDPSYAGQIVTFTYPHIGNYGVNEHDAESRGMFCRGLVIRDLTVTPSNWRATGGFESYLIDGGIPGIAGVDTRRLTRLIREQGVLNAAFGTAPVPELAAAAKAEVGTTGQDLATAVSTSHPYRLGDGPMRIGVLDFGIKRSSLRRLAEFATVEVLPARTPAEDVLKARYEAVMVSNGPGDPAALGFAVATVGELLGRVPLFGICLGHQLLGQALGAKTFKLPFGHHGGNHPVVNLATGAIEITSQNHNYAVAADSLVGAQITHLNLNDQVVEGLVTDDGRAFSVQYHPEAGPGPHDSLYLFHRLRDLLENGAA